MNSDTQTNRSDRRIVKKPTIAELEALLEREQQVEIEILPNGEIRPCGQTALSDLGGMKPLTMREDLGGEYAEGESGT